MSLQDVSNDRQMIDWLHQSGHGHLINENAQHASVPTSSSLTSLPFGYTTTSSNHPLPPTSLSSSSPILSGGLGGSNAGTSAPPPHPMSIFNHQSSYPLTDFHAPTNNDAIGTSLSPPIGDSQYGQHSSPLPLNLSPTQFLVSNQNQQQFDVDIENMKRDPNTRIVQRPPQEDVVYKQRVFVRYLQPPTPPVGGTIIVREKQPPAQPPDPPIVIKRAPPAPPTPPPITIRERPPPLPPTEGTTVIDKLIPSAPKPPPQLIIEQYPPLPPKPQDVIIERWLPVPPRTRRILYERLPVSSKPATRPIIVQYGPPQVRVKREVIVAPTGTQLPYQQVGGSADINQILSQIGGNSTLSSTLSPSSLVAYNPYSSIQPNYGTPGQSQSNIVIMQNGQPTVLPSSSYGVPLTHVSTPNNIGSLDMYGSGLSAIPAIGQSSGHTMVYNVPDNVPIDGILYQLGIDPFTIQRSSGSALPIDSHSAVGNVWNAASHANPLYPTNPNSAVSNVWNAAAYHSDRNRPPSPAVGHAWDRIENYLHGPSSAVRSAWDHITHSSSPPPQSNYPQYSASYPPPPTSSYPPPPTSSYPPPPTSSYPPPPTSSYPPPPPSSYPPSYPPNYPPSSPPTYPPPPPANYPPPSSGGSSGAASGVLSRLFGGSR